MYISFTNIYNCGFIVSHVRKRILNLNYWLWPKKLKLETIRPVYGKSDVLNSPWKVLFFGTDDFSVISLKKLVEEQENGKFIKQLEVVTVVKSKANVVQYYAEQKLLKVHSWPPNIACGEFDIGVVVSFGHLIPQNVISLFPLGMLNVHASLLPRWRGAAPIVYSIMNGDTETGVTIMQIKPHRFDIGGILKQGIFPLSPHITFPMVRNALACLGSELLFECFKELPSCFNQIQEQTEDGVSYAPRLTSSISVVNWNGMSSFQIYNLWRALESIYPLTSKWHGTTVKLFNARLVLCDEPKDMEDYYLDCVRPGYVYLHRSSKLLRVKCSDQKWISFKSVGLPGKKPMSCVDFYNGYISKKKKDDRHFE